MLASKFAENKKDWLTTKPWYIKIKDKRRLRLTSRLLWIQYLSAIRKIKNKTLSDEFKGRRERCRGIIQAHKKRGISLSRILMLVFINYIISMMLYNIN